MGIEIERKFLLSGSQWRSLAKGKHIRQGYIRKTETTTVRVRTSGDNGFLTIKGMTTGLTRLEFEYPIPLIDANSLLDQLCDHPLIEKIRYCVDYNGFTWEIDEFLGENEGLFVAEIELEHEEQYFRIPDWIGTEITGDMRYFNSNLVSNPFKKWKTKHL